MYNVDVDIAIGLSLSLHTVGSNCNNITKCVHKTLH